MALSLILLADGPSTNLVAHLGQAAFDLYGRLLADTVRIAEALPGARVSVRHSPAAPQAILAALPASVTCVAAPLGDAAAVNAALADGLAAGGPALVIGGALPHLPLWRLRDAATYLDGQADLVIGPSDTGSWYLLGLGARAADLLSVLPGPGAPLGRLAAGDLYGHVVHLLPPWFGITTVADLGSLADLLRTMPPEIAPQTRALLEQGQSSRAVGG